MLAVWDREACEGGVPLGPFLAVGGGFLAGDVAARFVNGDVIGDALDHDQREALAEPGHVPRLVDRAARLRSGVGGGVVGNGAGDVIAHALASASYVPRSSAR